MKTITQHVAATLAFLVLAPMAMAENGDHDRGELIAALITARAESEWPGLTVEAAAKALGTAESARHFVRDGVASVDYLGSFHGAAGTLRTRVANNTDKALLLAALLEKQGYKTEILSGPRFANAKPYIPQGVNRPRPALNALTSLVAHDVIEEERHALVGQGGSALSIAKKEIAALDKEIASSLAVVKRELARMKWQVKKPVVATAKTTPSSWIWVRAKKGNQAWKNYDVFSDEEKLPAHPAIIQPQPVEVKLSIESVEAAGGGTSLLSWNGTAHDLAGYDFHLGWHPNDERILSANDLTLPLDITIAQWVPVLRIGTTLVIGKSFDPSKARLVRLRITFSDDTSVAERKTRMFERVLQDLGSGFDKYEFVANHCIGISTAGVPGSVVEARVLDELLDIHQLRRFASGGTAPKFVSSGRGVVVRTAIIVNKMIATAAHLDPTGASFAWNGPSIFVETTKLRVEDGEIMRFTLLDMVNQAFAPTPSASFDLKLRWGLAVCAAEGQLVQGESVNQRLMRAKSSLQKVKTEEANGLVAASIAQGAIVFTAPSARSFAWAIHDDGTLLGIVSDRPVLQAKGGRSPSEKAKTATNIMQALAGRGPLGPMVGGIAGYLHALRKAFAGMTVRMQAVADAIGSGNTSGLTDGDEEMRDLIANLMTGMAVGYAKGYAKTATTAGFGPAAGAALGIYGAVGSPEGGLGEEALRALWDAFPFDSSNPPF